MQTQLLKLPPPWADAAFGNNVFHCFYIYIHTHTHLSRFYTTCRTFCGYLPHKSMNQGPVHSKWVQQRSSKRTNERSKVSQMSLQPWGIRKTEKEVLGWGFACWWLYCGSERGCVVDADRLRAARVVVGSSRREEMGERGADSCTEVNRRSLCVLPTRKSVTNYLCLCLKSELWRHFGWVQRKDA